jgi:hypothetical protein
MRGALFALLAAACLSGCGGKPPDPAEAQCRAQVFEDPTVKQMIAVQAGSLGLQMAQQGALAEAKRQALLACLRARGLAPPGGVEAPRAPSATFRSPF